MPKALGDHEKLCWQVVGRLFSRPEPVRSEAVQDGSPPLVADVEPFEDFEINPFIGSGQTDALPPAPSVEPEPFEVEPVVAFVGTPAPDGADEFLGEVETEAEKEFGFAPETVVPAVVSSSESLTLDRSPEVRIPEAIRPDVDFALESSVFFMSVAWKKQGAAQAVAPPPETTVPATVPTEREAVAGRVEDLGRDARTFFAELIPWRKQKAPRPSPRPAPDYSDGPSLAQMMVVATDNAVRAAGRKDDGHDAESRRPSAETATAAMFLRSVPWRKKAA